MDSTDRIIQKETFHYDTTNALVAIEKTDRNDTLVEKVIFGMEQHAIDFLEYLLVINKVVAGGDRFTSVHYDSGRIITYQFYDVNHALYGEMGFFYDSTGSVMEEIWIKHPEKRVVRRWTYRFIPEENRTKVTEWDTTGTVVYDTYLASDGSESVFTFLVDEDTLLTDRALIPYDLAIGLKNGVVDWEWIGGASDTVAHHTYALSGHELNNVGQHDLRPELQSKLRHGAWYRLTFHGETIRNYPATDMVFEPVIIDKKGPEISAVMDSIMDTIRIEITSNEPLGSLTLEMRQQENQITFPIIYAIEDSLLPFTKGIVTVPQLPGLKESIPYEVVISGKDRAGNYAEPVAAGSFVFDKSAPVINVNHPGSHTALHLPVLMFSNSEDLKSGAIVVLTEDDTSVAKPIPIPETHRPAGAHTLDLSPLFPFVDSTYYSVTIEGTDLGGNHSIPTSIDSLYYDITPPNVTVIFPFDSATINEPAMSYISNEQLSKAAMEWLYIVGTADTVAPYYVELTGSELKPGVKIRKSLPSVNDLVDGAIYTILLSAWDKAGNQIPKVQIHHVLYDASPPELELLSPNSLTTTNSLRLTYSSTEYLDQGFLRIERTGGRPDPQSPYEIQLVDDELKDGVHTDVLLAKLPILQSGSTYQYTLKGSDLGANQSTPFIVKNITYDNEKPVVSISYPVSGSINDRKSFSYELSEDIEEGYCILKRTDGAPDTLSPHVIPFVEDDLLEGAHEINIANLEIVESSVYTLTINGKDFAGNSADTAITADIIYDVTDPAVQLQVPKDNSLNTRVVLSYTLSERIHDAYVVWTQVGGENDPDSPHRIPLNEEESAMGSHHNITLQHQESLVSNAMYNVVVEGRDIANHPLKPNSIRGITYDFIAPSLSIIKPVSNSRSNYSGIEYELSEGLVTGSCLLMKDGSGASKPIVTKVKLKSDDLTSGYHTINGMNNSIISLEDNTPYSIWFSGEDQAGNRVISDTVRNFIFDSIKPAITLSKPVASMTINTTLISYSINEDLEQAEMIWKDEATGSELIVQLRENEMLNGEYEAQLLQGSPTLEDDHTYTLIFTGKDVAGNPAAAVEENNIRFDMTRPELLVQYPFTGTFINTTDIEFTLSESLGELLIEWLYYDDSGKEIKTQFISQPEMLIKGSHQLHQFHHPELKDGETYTINLAYTDLAGNEGMEVALSDITFDTTAPVLSNLFPQSGLFTTENRLELSLSEPVKSMNYIMIDRDKNQTELTVDSLITSTTLRWEGFFDQFPIRDGEPFALEILAVDRAGNPSNTLGSENIAIDKTPPEISIMNPSSRTVINRLQPVVVFSENLQSGSITIEPRNEPVITMDIPDSLLKKGSQRIEMIAVAIDDNVPMTLQVTGMDRAGNRSNSKKLEYVRFDRKKPSIEITHPQNDALLNKFSVAYSIDENLDRAVLQLIQDSDKDTTEVELKDVFIKKGNHNLIDRAEFSNMQENVSYSITVWGIDPAGNASTKQMITGIQIDNTAPNIELIHPVSSARVNTKNISYSLSENLDRGEIIITGSDNKKYGRDLMPNELQSGTHDLTLADEIFPAISGKIYHIKMDGKDRAGNNASSAVVTKIIFDNSPPTISISSPIENTTVSQVQLSYSINERLDKGSIGVEKISEEGNTTTFKKELNPEELSPGDHERILAAAEYNFIEGDMLTIRISGLDQAGNEGSSEPITKVRFDNKSPTIRVRKPTANSLINDLLFSLRFSELLERCSFNINRIDGLQDPNAPYHFEVTSNELQQKVFSDFPFANRPVLMDEVSYEITIQGQDFAKNQSEKVIIRGVQLDTKAPTYTLSKPVDGEKISMEEVGYILSENLGSGEVLFRYQSGTPDANKKHRASLHKSNLTKGPHLNTAITFDIPLVDGARYTVSVEGSDEAGNLISGQPAGNVLFDAYPPEITILSPEPNTMIPSLAFSYQFSEDLSLAKLLIDNQRDNPITLELSTVEKTAGKHTISISDRVTIEEGIPYRYQMTGIDQAGNESSSNRIDNVIFDETLPQLTISAPVDGEKLRRFLLSYSLSEQLSDFNVTIEQTAGEPDDQSPIHFLLPEYLIQKGSFESIDLEDFTTLVDGAEYRLAFAGNDIAGNAMNVSYVNNLILDKTPPQLIVDQPKPDSFNKKKVLQFTLSESLESGKIEWIWKQGEPDIETHTIELADDKLTAGDQSLPEIEDIHFANGSIFNVKFTLMDAAQNMTEHVVENVMYDYEAPVVEVISPVSKSRVNTETLQFVSNEVMRICRVTWVDLTTNEAHIFIIPKDMMSGREFTVSKDISNLIMVNDHLYQIKIFARDFAGNQKETLVADSVIFDTKPPIFSDISPQADSYTHTSAVSYRLNEPCQSGRLVWLRVSGPDDPTSPHIIELNKNNLKQGMNNTDNLKRVPLKEGASYAIVLSATDQLGNKSRQFNTPNILVDTSPPVLTLIQPKTGSYINTGDIKIGLNEPLLSAEIEVRRTSGESDPNSPATIKIDPQYLSTPNTVGIKINDFMALENDVVYTIVYTGVDRAGNMAQADPVQNITFDSRKPQLGISLPAPQAVFTTANMQLSFSENLISAYVTWDNENSPGKAPIQMLIPENYLSAGDRIQVPVDMDLPFDFSASYTLVLHGTDVAGNAAGSNPVHGVVIQAPME